MLENFALHTNKCRCQSTEGFELMTINELILRAAKPACIKKKG
jgi:hypothetical protein